MKTGYKTIAVHVSDAPQSIARTKLAAHLAMKFGAHLIGVAATGLPATLYLGGLTGEGAAVIPAYIDMLNARAGRSLARFVDEAVREGADLPEKRIIEEETGIALCLQARYCDLVVVGQDNPNEVSTGLPPMVAEYVLLHSINPVLVVPHIGEFATVWKRVMVAWDGSLAAARAVHGAIPLLRQAELVQVAVFNAEAGAGIHGEEPGADIALFLARHGVRVEVSRFATASQTDIGQSILSQSRLFGSDLLVMGGYGHARFREVVLGGATRTVLRGMEAPVLISH